MLYALATRTQSDEVLGSRGRFTGSPESVPKNSTTEGSTTITPTRVSPHADTPLRSLPTKSFASAWKVSFLREFGVT